MPFAPARPPVWLLPPGKPPGGIPPGIPPANPPGAPPGNPPRGIPPPGTPLRPMPPGPPVLGPAVTIEPVCGWSPSSPRMPWAGPTRADRPPRRRSPRSRSAADGRSGAGGVPRRNPRPGRSSAATHRRPWFCPAARSPSRRRSPRRPPGRPPRPMSPAVPGLAGSPCRRVRRWLERGDGVVLSWKIPAIREKTRPVTSSQPPQTT